MIRSNSIRSAALCTAIAASIFLVPALAHAESLSASLSSGNIVNLWEFARSLINWGLVAFLIFVAFANTTRLGGDSYTIKKTIPGLITGFILANLSFAICREVINVADSLALTAGSIAQQATGATIFDFMFKVGWTPGVTALLGLILSVALFTSGFGIVIGFLLMITIMLLPLIIIVILGLMFIIRNYVITLLVVVSPLAFIAMGTSFTNKWFSRWWGQFTLWVFMKPIAFGLLSLGAIAMKAGVPNTAVGYIVGLASMAAAITVPWKSGGWINQAVQSWGGRGLGLARSATLSQANKLAESNSRFAGAGAAVSGLLSAPTAFKLARKKQEDKAEEASVRNAAGLLKNTSRDSKQYAKLQHSLEDKRIGELRDDYKGKSSEELGKLMDNAKTPLEFSALQQELADRGHLGRVYGSMQNGPASLDPETVKRWEIEKQGGTVNANNEIEGDLALRMGARIDDAHKKNGVTQYGFRQKYNSKTGKTELLTNAKSAETAAGMYETDPWTIPKSLTSKGVISEYVVTDSAGRPVTGPDGKPVKKKKLFGAVPKAIADGVIDQEVILNNRGFDRSGLKAIHDNWNDGLETQLDADFNSYLAVRRTDEEKRLREVNPQITDTELTNQLDATAASAKRNFEAFKDRVRPDGSLQAARARYPELRSNRGSRPARAPRATQTAPTPEPAAAQGPAIITPEPRGNVRSRTVFS